MNALSLYTGIGGIDLAAEACGWNVVAMCEADPKCRLRLERHWPGIPIFESDEDITADSLRALGIGDIDLVFGGPPCQPHSVAGKQEHKADPRYRWPEMARIVAELRPCWVLVENVSGFRRLAESTVSPDLEALGYEVALFGIPIAGVGAPHKRDRVFVVAHSDHTGRGERRGTESMGEEQRSAERSGSQAVADSGGLRVVRCEECWNEGKRRWDVEGYDVCVNEAGLRKIIQTEISERDTDRTVVDAAIIRPKEGNGDSETEVGRSSRRSDRRPAEPRLGGDLDGLSGGLDGPRWPAPRGAEQYPWEPPRVTERRDQRRERLKMLGNACSMWQALPVLKAMRKAS